MLLASLVWILATFFFRPVCADERMMSDLEEESCDSGLRYFDEFNIAATESLTFDYCGRPMGKLFGISLEISDWRLIPIFSFGMNHGFARYCGHERKTRNSGDC